MVNNSDKKITILQIIILLIIIVIASFFRIWQLSSIPPGIYPDEAMNGNDAITSLQTHSFKIFYPNNNGREGIFIWLIALSFSILKPSIFTFKIVSSIFGILTVLGIYFLTEELFSYYPKVKARSISLLSSFFLAVSFWHTNFSRIGFRAILVPFFFVFGFYFLFKGFRLKKYFHIIISGILLGFGFYTYISYRFVVLIIIIALIGFWIIYKKQNQKKFFWELSFWLFLSIFIIALPLGIYFLSNPSAFFGRAAGVSILSQGNPFYNLIKSTILHLGMFNIHGDNNWRHNFSGAPELFLPVGLFFLIGIILLFSKIFKKENYQRNSYQLLFTSYFLFSGFFISLLPGFLSYEGIPHSLRVIGVVPFVYIFTAFGFYWLFEKIKVFFKTNYQKLILYFCLFIFLFAIALFQFNKYFFKWAKNPAVKNAFSENYVEIGNYLNSLPKNIKKYVIVNQSGVPVPYPNGIPVSAQTTMFIERMKFGETRAIYILPTDISKIKINNCNAVFIPLHPDSNLFNSLHSKFPKGKIKKEKDITFYKIN